MLPSIYRSIQNIKKLAQPEAGITAIWIRPLGDERGEDVSGVEDAGIVGEEAENEPNEKPLQVVPFVARLFQGVVELAHHFGGLNVDRVLVAEGPLLDAEDETKGLYVLRKLVERESSDDVVFEVMQFEALEIADENVTGKLVLFQAGEVIKSLLLGAREVTPRALLLYEQYALPEKVDKAALVAEFLYRFLEAGDPATRDAEHLEEFVVEGLALATLIVSVLPLVGEACRACSDFVPTEAHLISIRW